MTIEERAKAYAHRNGTDFLSGFENAEVDAYIEGAYEQRQIDIDKVCTWLKEMLPARTIYRLRKAMEA